MMSLNERIISYKNKIEVSYLKDQCLYENEISFLKVNKGNVSNLKKIFEDLTNKKNKVNIKKNASFKIKNKVNINEPLNNCNLTEKVKKTYILNKNNNYTNNLLDLKNMLCINNDDKIYLPKNKFESTNNSQKEKLKFTNTAKRFHKKEIKNTDHLDKKTDKPVFSEEKIIKNDSEIKNLNDKKPKMNNLKLITEDVTIENKKTTPKNTSYEDTKTSLSCFKHKKYEDKKNYKLEIFINNEIDTVLIHYITAVKKTVTISEKTTKVPFKIFFAPYTYRKNNFDKIGKLNLETDFKRKMEEIYQNYSMKIKIIENYFRNAIRTP